MTNFTTKVITKYEMKKLANESPMFLENIASHKFVANEITVNGTLWRDPNVIYHQIVRYIELKANTYIYWKNLC